MGLIQLVELVLAGSSQIQLPMGIPMAIPMGILMGILMAAILTIVNV